MRKNFVAALFLSLLAVPPAHAWQWPQFSNVSGLVVDPHTFTAGTPILSSQVNSRFTVLYNLMNGNIDNANIKGSANIDPSKINRQLEFVVTRASGQSGLGVSMAGDSKPRVSLFSDGLLMFGTGLTPDVGISRDSADYLQVRGPAGLLDARGLKMADGWFSEAGDTNPRVYITGQSNVGYTPGVYFGITNGSVLAQDGSTGLKLLGVSSLGIAGSGYKNLHIGELNLETPLPFAEGGTGGVTGTAGQSVRIASSGTSLEGYNQSPTFGGNGSDGTVTKGTTSDSIKQINAALFSQTTGTTWTPATGLGINSSGAAAFNGTTTVGNLANGPANALTSAVMRIADGCGNAGHGGQNSTNPGGGGGGGFGGAGGNGGDNSNNLFGLGGKTVPLPNISTGGAGGCGGSDSSNLGGDGGSRGGIIRVCAAGAITFGGSSTVETNGQSGGAGAAGNAAGGGAGAGGHQGYYSLTGITFSSGCVVRANGGKGGDAASSTGGVGSGGGGGRIVYMSPSNTVTTAPTAAGGAIGTTGRTTNSSAGSSGVVVGITGTPTLPLVAHVERSNAIAWAYHMKRNDGQPANFEGREIASFLSALYAKPGKSRQLNTALLFGSDEAKLQDVSVMDCKGIGEQPGFEFKQDVVEGDTSLLPQA